MEVGETIGEYADRALRRACGIYDQLADCLSAMITQLDEHRDGGRQLSKEELDLLRSHQKVLVMVLDFEAQLIRRRKADPGEADAPFDLDAARSEIARRLDRIAAARGP